MNLDNFIDIAITIKRIGIEDAETYNNGVPRGTFRKLNFSYNHFTKSTNHNNGPNMYQIEDENE